MFSKAWRALGVGPRLYTADEWYPYKAEEVDPAFRPDGKVSPVEYVFRSRRPPSPGRSVSLSRT